MWPADVARSDLPLVDLTFSTGAMLILEAKTGIQYTNQAGGIACIHPAIEGFLFPLEREGYRDLAVQARLEDYFCEPGEQQHKWGAGRRGGGLTPRDAAAIDALLLDVVSPDFCLLVQVDRERADEGDEAWIRVVVSRAPDARNPCVLDRLPQWPLKGVLTWENSD